MTPLLEGKTGLIMGVANKRSIAWGITNAANKARSEEHTSELQSPCNLVCRLLLEKKNSMYHKTTHYLIQMSRSVSRINTSYSADHKSVGSSSSSYCSVALERMFCVDAH